MSAQTATVSTYKFWETIRWDIPALMLVVLLVGFAYSILALQRRDDFDFAGMYIDENKGKVSLWRVTGFGTWIVGTWVVMQDMLDGVPTIWLQLGYLAIFSGNKIVEKIVDKWNGGIPLSGK